MLISSQQFSSKSLYPNSIVGMKGDSAFLQRMKINTHVVSFGLGHQLELLRAGGVLQWVVHRWNEKLRKQLSEAKQQDTL